MGYRLPEHFVTHCLRGAGQVFFMENALSGVCFLLAIAYASFDTGNWSTTLGALLGLAVATGTAYLIDSHDSAIAKGMYGFNGILVGVAVPTFLVAGPVMWVYLILGAAVSTVVMDAFSNVVSKNWGVAASTGPFVLTTWLLMLGAYAFSNLPIAAMGPPKLPLALANSAFMGLSLLDTLVVVCRNIAQVFLLGNAVSGVLIVIGLLLESIPAAIAAVMGSLVALFCAMLFGADAGAVKAGLYGFSPVLTAIAVGVIFMQTGPKVLLFALLATVFTVIVQGALDTLLAPVGIPTFTAPYVLAMWLFTLPKAQLQPHPHAPSPDAKISKIK
ncbi:urea transporter [Craterilacuibacter sp. RT1T]|uniref:urea transporter n=1 Tax=Craterilacuibacter sp. RT1T TaxID=2942211 RepID=UPI0020BE824F|nr:urea transporter [Craterilacuibacter sp. RT1T]MCL6263192.1 urea transporter [Craterilacuibacter sp. RT1T]